MTMKTENPVYIGLSEQDPVQSVLECDDYIQFIYPWVKQPELVNGVQDLIRTMFNNPEKAEDAIDLFLDGEFGSVLACDTRYTGNGLNSIRRLVQGAPLELRASHARGVSDRSGIK